MDAGLPRYNTPSRYLDSTTKSSYGRTVVNQYLHRIVEAAVQGQISDEYLPPESSFRMNFAESPLEVALELYFLIQNADLLLLQNSDRKRERERVRCWYVVFSIENLERYL